MQICSLVSGMWRKTNQTLQVGMLYPMSVVTRNVVTVPLRYSVEMHHFCGITQRDTTRHAFYDMVESWASWWYMFEEKVRPRQKNGGQGDKVYKQSTDS